MKNNFFLIVSGMQNKFQNVIVITWVPHLIVTQSISISNFRENFQFQVLVHLF